MIGLIEKPPRRDFDWTHNAESLDPMQATLYRLGGWSGFRHTQPPMLRHTPTYKGPTPPKKTKAILQFCTRLTNEDWAGISGFEIGSPVLCSMAQQRSCTVFVNPPR